MQVISGIEFLLDRADNFAEYIDEDYSVDIDSIDYIYEAEEISDWLQEIVEEGEVAKHNATVSNTGNNGSGMSNGSSYSSSSGGLTQSSGVYYYGVGRKHTTQVEFFIIIGHQNGPQMRKDSIETRMDTMS